jgi:hypothetical protein
MEEPDEIDGDEDREEENPDPNGGPSVAGLLLIGFGLACFFGRPLRNSWVNDWTVLLLNLPIAGAMVGAGIGVLSGNGRRGAVYGVFAGICIAALSLINDHLIHLRH